MKFMYDVIEEFDGNVVKSKYSVDEKRRFHGEMKVWYDNGQLERHCFFEHGDQHGEYRLWYRNGQIHKHCFYNKNFPQGEYKIWTEDGRLLQHRYVIDGTFYKTEDVTKEELVVLILGSNLSFRLLPE